MGLLTKVGLNDLETRPPRERATFFFLVAMTMFLFMDQNLTSPNLDKIAEELVTTHQAVEAELARSDPEYQQLTTAWEQRRDLVTELTREVADLSADARARTPALAN